MIVEIQPKMRVSILMGYLKGKNRLMIFDKWGDIKYRYRNG